MNRDEEFEQGYEQGAEEGYAAAILEASKEDERAFAESEERYHTLIEDYQEKTRYLQSTIEELTNDLNTIRGQRDAIQLWLGIEQRNVAELQAQVEAAETVLEIVRRFVYHQVSGQHPSQSDLYDVISNYDEKYHPINAITKDGEE